VLAWRFPRLYDLHFRLSTVAPELRRREIAAVLSAVADLADPNDHVYEIGAGPGTYTRLLAQRVARVTTFDREPKMVERLATTLDQEHLDNVSAQVGCMPDDVDLTPPADGLVAAGVLDYAADLTAWLRTCRGGVVPGGWLVLTVPYAHGQPRATTLGEGWLAGRSYPRTEAQLRQAAAEAGLTVLGVEAVGLRGRTYTLVGACRVPPD